MLCSIMYKAQQLKCVDLPLFQYQTLASVGGLINTDANPFPLQSHDATKLFYLHNACHTTTSLPILEPALLSQHKYTIYEQGKDDIGTLDSSWSDTVTIPLLCCSNFQP